jgi:hypothetical protein
MRGRVQWQPSCTESIPTRRYLGGENEFAGRPAGYNEYFENKFVPAWRKAGLPE